jgi:lysozyme
MTSAYLISDLERDEGFRAQAYPDPLTHSDPWTVGYGATGPTITQGTVWTQAQAEADLVQRVATLTTQLAANLPWFVQVSDLRQDVLVNMAYNMGLTGLLAFHKTLTLISEGDYAGAATDMLQSLWAKQVPNRAMRLAVQMKTGLHAGVTTSAVAPTVVSVPTSAPSPSHGTTPATGPAVIPTAAPTPQRPMTATAPDFSPTPVQLPSQATALIQSIGTHLGSLAGGALVSWGAIQPNQETQLATIAGGIAVWGASLLVSYIVQYLRHQQAEKAVTAALNTPVPKAA